MNQETDCTLNISLHVPESTMDFCKNLALTLCELETEGRVIPTVSSVCSLHPPNAGKFVIEEGCSIKLFIPKPQDICKVWKTLQKKYNLSCANIKYRNFNGCLESWLDEYS